MRPARRRMRAGPPATGRRGESARARRRRSFAARPQGDTLSSLRRRMIRNSTAAMTTAISTYHAVPNPAASGAGAGAVDWVAIGAVGAAATAGDSVFAAVGSDFMAVASVLVAGASVLPGD